MSDTDKKNMDCPECGSPRAVLEIDRTAYLYRYSCPDCGHEGEDCFGDVHGCMSVPWGYLL